MPGTEAKSREGNVKSGWFSVSLHVGWTRAETDQNRRSSSSTLQNGCIVKWAVDSGLLCHPGPRICPFSRHRRNQDLPWRIWIDCSVLVRFARGCERQSLQPVKLLPGTVLSTPPWAHLSGWGEGGHEDRQEVTNPRTEVRIRITDSGSLLI